MTDWLSGAKRDPIPGVTGAAWERESKPAWKLLLHTTEGVSYLGARNAYKSGGYAPHVTIGPDPARPGKVAAWQHLPFSARATTLSDRAGGIRPNREHVLQAEIVGFCDPDRRTHKLYVHRWSEPYKRGVAKWLRAMLHARPIPARSTVKWVDYPKSYGLKAAQRLSAAAFDAYAGILGHQHAPESTHGDPGDLSQYINDYLITEADLTPDEHRMLKDLHKQLQIDSLREEGETHGPGYYHAHTDLNAHSARVLAEQIVDSLRGLYGKHDQHVEDVQRRLTAIEQRLDALTNTAAVEAQ